MENSIPGLQGQEKPCLVKTGQGFSVFYKGRYLYSKYSPDKTVLQLVNGLKILPGTLFVISSPVLWYGLEELEKKLPPNCFILAVEADINLYSLARETLGKIAAMNPAAARNLLLLPPEKIPYIVNIVLGQEMDSTNGDEKKTSVPPLYNFRRAVYLEFSGGSSMCKDLYTKAVFQVQGAIGSFWKNRITLTRLGRLFSRNIFKNLSMIPLSIDFSCFRGKIGRPVFIFGAGESSIETLREIKADMLRKCFVICVDAALPILKAFNITPDAAVAVEGQLAIEKAYIGSTARNSYIFADMSSRSSVLRHTEKGFSFLSSQYTSALFLDKLKSKSFFPKTIPALGSVGLTASYIALLIRKDASVPVFASGLDFNFSLGKTHAQNAPAHTTRLLRTNRLREAADYRAAFKNGAKRTGKRGGKDLFTDIALTSYAESFKDVFSRQENFFNCSACGEDIGIPFVDARKVNDFLGNVACKARQEELRPAAKAGKTEIEEYLKDEKAALERIKTLLSSGKEADKTQEEFDRELNALIPDREYLFLHFPDGYKCDTKNLSFLKRVRSEIDFFLKDIESSLRVLQSES